jgi:hypothetical protein
LRTAKHWLPGFWSVFFWRSSELRIESQHEAYAESMALGQRIINRIISGAEEF